MIDMNSSIKIEIDAFNLIIKICLNQQADSKRHSATYFSKKLSSTEQNYDIHDKKLLIIIAALKHWKIYAKNASSLNIYTNHKNLLQFIIIKELNQRLVWWAEELNQYKFKIHYISERKITEQIRLVEDAITWLLKKIDYNILKINDDGIISANHY